MPELSYAIQAHRAPASQPAPSNIFYPHGVWAPGVKLMRNLRFGSKAILITLCFLIPLVWVSYKYASDRNDLINFSEAELSGLEYNQKVFPLIIAAQELRRDLVGQVTSGSVPSTLGEVQAKVKSAQSALADVDGKLGASLDTRKSFAAAQQAFSEALRTDGTPGVYDAYTAYVQSLLALMAHVTDKSNLALDPDLDSYYLMDAAYFRLPVLLDNSGEVRGRGYRALLSGKDDAALRSKLTSMMAVTNYEFGNLQTSLDKAIAANASLAGKLSTGDAIRATGAFTAYVGKAVLETPDYSADGAGKVRTLGNDAVAEQFSLAVRVQDALKELLHIRVSRLSSTLWMTLTIFAVGVLVAAYFFYCFFLVTRGGLHLISKHLRDMADGDLRLAPSQPWGSDEPAEVIVDLRATYDALHVLIQSVRISAHDLTQTAHEISAGSDNLAARTEASASTLEEQASAMEEIGSTVASTAEQAQSASTFSKENSSVAVRGGQVIGDVVKTMREIHDSSARINDIIGVIDGIAFQTNILALNAAVEAARAGEAGRGFAVVAGEVRNLSQRTSEAAREVKSLITASVGKVESGTHVVEEAGVTMGTVVSNAKRIDQLLDEIALAARDQAAGVEQSAQAIQSLDHDTQQNAALVEETSVASVALRQQADALMLQIEKFRVG